MHLRESLLTILGLVLLSLESLGGRLHAQTPDTIPAIRMLNDSLIEINLANIYVSAHRTVRPLTPTERQQLWRRIRDVKKVYPYAKYVAATIIETYEYMQTLPEKEQEPHLKRVEVELKRDMEPKMKDLTLGQGKLLIKLVNRQCGMTGYELVQTFLGGFKAWPVHGRSTPVLRGLTSSRPTPPRPTLMMPSPSVSSASMTNISSED